MNFFNGTTPGHRARIYDDDELVGVHNLNPGRAVTFGRAAAADLALGAGTETEPPDLKVSKLAVSVRVDDVYWEISTPNLRGAVVRPWLAQSIGHAADSKSRTDRAGVCIEVAGDGRRHRILLERRDSRALPPLPAAASTLHEPDTPTPVTAPRRTGPLTDLQLDAVQLMFERYLLWPPPPEPRVRTLGSVARRLRRRPRAVSLRLETVRERVIDIIGHTSVTSPALLYALADRAFLLFPYEEIDGN